MTLRRQLVGLGFAETRSVSLVKADPAAGWRARSRTRSRKTARFCAARCCRACWPRRAATCARDRRDLRLFEVGQDFFGGRARGRTGTLVVGIC